MEGPSAVLNVLTIPSGATSTQARIVIDGVRGAIFVYQNGGPHGALIGSWAKSAGTDPYTNPYPQGLNVQLGSLTGTQEFLYSPTEAAGNLIYSNATAADTDAFGNAFLAGTTTYFKTGGGIYLATNFGNGQLTFYEAGTEAGPWNAGPVIFTDSGGGLHIQSSAEDIDLSLAGKNVLLLASLTGALTSLGLCNGTVASANIATISADVHGNLQNFASTDTNTYTAGHVAQRAAANQQITSVIPATIGISFNVAVGPVYHLFIMAVISPDQAAGSAMFGWDGNAVAGNANGYGEWKQNQAVPNVTTWDGSLAGTAGSHAFALGIEQVFAAEVWTTFTTGGTLNVRAQEGTAGDSYHIKSCIGIMEVIG